MRYWNGPASKTLADTRRVLGWLSKTSSRYNSLAWAVADTSSGRLTGMVNYHNREARMARLEIGYLIARDQQRKGFGAEAVSALIDCCTRDLKVHRVAALIHPENVASIALAEALGFRCEGGPLVDYACVDGVFHSVMVYARVGV